MEKNGSCSLPVEFKGTFSHACVVVDDIEKAVDSYQKLLGCERPRIKMTGAPEDARVQYRGEPTNARAIQAFVQMDSLRIELLQPDGNPSTWRDFLDRNGNSFHHIAYDVPDMDAALELFASYGAPLLQMGYYNGGVYAYIDSERTFGVMLELLMSTR